MVLFLVKYPVGESVKEGMSQRILNIDSFYNHEKRVYLDISISRNLSSRKNVIDDKLTVYHYNAFLHCLSILKYFKVASKIYIHSVYNVLPSLLFILLFSKHYILDVHGVVPEENEMIGKTFRRKIYDFAEYVIFHKTDITAVVVTNNMKEHYQKKFANNNAKFVNYIIFPNNLKNISLDMNVISEDRVNIVYAGNLQKWQNIDLMIRTITKLMDHQNYYFYILTGEPAKMQELLMQKVIDFNRISLQSLPPYELERVYKLCHYGFVLRDDIIVNNVACPTKIIEYMHYGIIPIVLNDKIGDFKEYDYESVKIDYLDNLKPNKSLKNIEIIKQMQETNSQVNIYSL